MGSDSGLVLSIGDRVTVALAQAVPVTGGLELELVDIDGRAISRGPKSDRRKRSTQRAPRKSPGKTLETAQEGKCPPTLTPELWTFGAVAVWSGKTESRIMLNRLGAVLLTLCVATPLAANAPGASLRPELRPDPAALESPVATRSAQAWLAASPRPQPRDTAPERAQTRVSDAGFAQWIEGFRRRARAAGIRDAVFDQAFRGIQLNDTVLDRDRNQSEFTRALWDYLDSAVSTSRVRNGREALRENRRVRSR